MSVHNHPPYRPMCNERDVDGQLRGACINDDGSEHETWGMCTACGSIEVTLNNPTGTRDLSHIGESDRYPTGYGCELCA